MSHVVCFAALCVSKNIPCSTFPSENLLLSVPQRYNILSSKYSTISMEQSPHSAIQCFPIFELGISCFLCKKITSFFLYKNHHVSLRVEILLYFCFEVIENFVLKILVQLRLKIYDIMLKNFCILSQRVVNYTFLCIKWYGDKHNHLRRSTCCSFYL